MRGYFDTSALVPLVIAEPTTRRCEELWNGADDILSSSLAYVEVHAALAQATRQGRLSEIDHKRALRTFEARWTDVVPIWPNDLLIQTAARLSATHALRGYDAVHCATALVAASDDFIAVSGDRELLHAWSALGLATVDTST